MDVIVAIRTLERVNQLTSLTLYTHLFYFLPVKATIRKIVSGSTMKKSPVSNIWGKKLIALNSSFTFRY
jgi:hypothetical protein